MKLLLRPRVAIFTQISILAHGRLKPIVALLHIGTRRRPILEYARISALVSRVVILRTREALTTKTRWPLALLRLVVDKYIVGLIPLGVLVEYALLLEARRQVQRLLVDDQIAHATTTRGRVQTSAARAHAIRARDRHAIRYGQVKQAYCVGGWLLRWHRVYLLLLLLQLHFFQVVDGRSHVGGTVSERAVWAVLGAVALDVRFVDARGRLVVAEVVAFLGVAGVSMHVRTLVGHGTRARLLVVLFAVHVRVVVEGAVAFAYRSAPTLVLEMPVEASVRSVLGAFVLQKERALLDTKAF